MDVSDVGHGLALECLIFFVCEKFEKKMKRKKDKGEEKKEDEGENIHFVATFNHQYLYFINDIKFALTKRTI